MQDRPRDLRQILGDVAASGAEELVETDPQSAMSMVEQAVVSATADEETISAQRVQQLRALIYEQLRRGGEPTAIYEPQPQQIGFHQSQARERTARGANRSGKTLMAAMEVAWVATKRHPWRKPPPKARKGGTIFCVGRDEDHIADVMWPKLSKADESFQRIRDEVTGLWRAYRPETDAHRAEEAEAMPPLLPERLFDGKPAWTKKNRGVVDMVRLKTGWTLQFFTGKGDPPQGAIVDLVWFDEEIPNAQWYIEMAARLLDRKGSFIWSATPQAGSTYLYELSDEALRETHRLQEDRRRKIPTVTEHFMSLADNPHIEEEEKERLKQKYANDPDAYRVRILGEFLIDGSKVYPTYSEQRHVCKGFPVPRDWTRYVIIDPGHTVCCLTFFAVPPPADETHSGRKYVYDVRYIRNCDAEMFAREMKTGIGQHFVEAFIIDDHGSRRTETSSGQTIAEHYSEELKKVGVGSRQTGCGFVRGESNVKNGLERVRGWLGGLDDDEPVLQIMDHCAEHASREMKHYQKKVKVVRGERIVLDEPEQKNNHFCDTLRYAAMHRLPWVKPVDTSTKSKRLQDYLQAKQDRQNKGRSRAVVLG